MPPRPFPVTVHHIERVLSPFTEEETGPQKGSRDLLRSASWEAAGPGWFCHLWTLLSLLFRLRHPALLHPSSPRLPLPILGLTGVQNVPSATLNTSHQQPHWHRTTEIINCKKTHRSNEARSRPERQTHTSDIGPGSSQPSSGQGRVPSSLQTETQRTDRVRSFTGPSPTQV